MIRRYLKACAVLLMVAGGTACTTTPPPSYDYTAFRANRPASVVVLPPLNRTVDVNATYGVLARATAPLAESGYYVVPVAVVDESLKQNGLANPDDMHGAPPGKLRDVFGADAALYMEVSQYGASYQVLASHVTVSVKARLVDLRSGELLWEGAATASTADRQQQSGGLVEMLVVALVTQIINAVSDDRSQEIAAQATTLLLGAGRPMGMLYGPRSPKYLSD